MFGLTSSTPKAAITSQVDSLKEAWKESTERQIEHANKFNELVKYAETVSESYIHSVNVILDVTKLLNAYNDLLLLISADLAKLNSVFSESLKADDIARLRNETLKKIDEINNSFNEDFLKIKERISKVDGENPALKELNTIQARTKSIDTETLRNTLKGGKSDHSKTLKGGIKVKLVSKDSATSWD